MGDDVEKFSGNPGTPGGSLKTTIESNPSTLKAAGGREIRFDRAVLVMRNTSGEALVDVSPRVTVVQEGGEPHEMSEALAAGLGESVLPPGGALRWDLYDLLVAGHPGVASKVHLFGYKAILNWWFEFEVGVDYRSEAGSPQEWHSTFRGKFRWNASKDALDQVELSVEPL